MGLTLLGGCRNADPVLTGIPDKPVLTAEPTDEFSTEAQVERKDDSEVTKYVKPEGVWIDVRHFGGRSFRQNRDRLVTQMGEITSMESLANDRGREIHFATGSLRLLNDKIYLIKVALPESTRRSNALELLGFPPFSDDPVTTHREYRFNHEWDFRRIRMVRLDA